jgi:hypothetical protein
VKQFVIFGYSGTGTSLFVLPPVNICSLLNAKALLLPVSEKQFVVGAHFPLTTNALTKVVTGQVPEKFQI